MDEFIKFLKKYRAYKKFVRNLSSYMKQKDNDINTYLSNEPERDYLWSAFTWSDTPEKFHYWSDLNNKWGSS